MHKEINIKRTDGSVQKAKIFSKSLTDVGVYWFENNECFFKFVPISKIKEINSIKETLENEGPMSETEVRQRSYISCAKQNVTFILISILLLLFVNGIAAKFEALENDFFYCLDQNEKNYFEMFKEKCVNKSSLWNAFLETFVDIASFCSKFFGVGVNSFVAAVFDNLGFLEETSKSSINFIRPRRQFDDKSSENNYEIKVNGAENTFVCANGDKCQKIQEYSVQRDYIPNCFENYLPIEYYVTADDKRKVKLSGFLSSNGLQIHDDQKITDTYSM
ncbi:unnamed protein product [Brachionus calyciflorus]|uniref:Uncharacterized protein n=1 Tax=Brachionus calyciflorus TaxID=104777 RepID=A0A814HFY2_9BILA|nr:unnamed protein product [Brachionus calyciflorus]